MTGLKHHVYILNTHTRTHAHARKHMKGKLFVHVLKMYMFIFQSRNDGHTIRYTMCVSQNKIKLRFVKTRLLMWRRTRVSHAEERFYLNEILHIIRSTISDNRLIMLSLRMNNTRRRKAVVCKYFSNVNVS